MVPTGVLAEPWSAETRFTRVDFRDVAEVAAIAPTEDRLLYGTYELGAEGNHNRHEVAALMSDVLGKPITAAKLSLSTPANSSTNVSDDEQMAAMRAMFEWYDTHGLLGNALTLRATLGREPRTLAAYIHELAATNQAAD